MNLEPRTAETESYPTFWDDAPHPVHRYTGDADAYTEFVNLAEDDLPDEFPLDDPSEV